MTACFSASWAVSWSTVVCAAAASAEVDDVPAIMPVAAWFSSSARRSPAASSACASGPSVTAVWSSRACTTLVAFISRVMSFWKICSTSGSATTMPISAAITTRGNARPSRRHGLRVEVIVEVRNRSRLRMMRAHTIASGTAIHTITCTPVNSAKNIDSAETTAVPSSTKNICTKRGVSAGTSSRMSPSAPPRIARRRDSGIRRRRPARGRRPRGAASGSASSVAVSSRTTVGSVAVSAGSADAASAAPVS